MKVRDVKWCVVLALLGVACGATSAFALAVDVPFNVNNLNLDSDLDTYSIWVPNGSGSGTGWYGTQQDQSVLPNCVASQRWDLEGIFASNGTLGTHDATDLANITVTMVGGFDFKGVDGVNSGDIFIDTKAGLDGFPTQPTQADYDYVMHVINWGASSATYEVYKIDASATLQSVTYSQNAISDPWVYVKGGTDKGVSGTILYQSGLSDAQTGFKGDLAADKNGPAGDDFAADGPSHYAASFDLGWLSPLLKPGDVTVGIHFTEQCGNDDLMGVYSGKNIITPEPASLVLMALAVGGFLARRAVRGRLA